MSNASERSPLLSPPTANSQHPPRPYSSRPSSTHSRASSYNHYTEDDTSVEGLVLILLSYLSSRGYAVPEGLVEAPPEDFTADEADQERRLYLGVLEGVRRHKRVLDKFMPDLTVKSDLVEANGKNAKVGDGAGLGLGSSIDLSVQTSSSPSPANSSKPRLNSSSPTPSTSHLPITPSPLSSVITPASIDYSLIPAPSALFLCALLSLLISLQAEPVPQASPRAVANRKHGVDAELRAFKSRRELGERLYAVVEGLLDSYLLEEDVQEDDDESGDEGVEDGLEGGDDELVRLLFHDFALNFDSLDRASCAMDLLLNLSSYPLVEAENLVSHPVVLATTEYVWRNGLVPAPREAAKALSWRATLFNLDRFAVPRILHSQAYVLSTLHAFITVYILMFSAYAHFDSLNPLAPDAPDRIGIPENGSPKNVKTWSFVSALFWWLWVAGVVGWFGEVLRAWHHRGPHPSLPLSPSTLLPLIHHALVFFSLLLRFSLIFFRRPSPILLSTSLTLLAWSVPFLAASRILPQNLPAFGAPTHFRWSKIRDGKKRREFGYRSPPKGIAESHRALRAIEAHLGGLVQFGTYFLVFGVLLLWSLSGELDYPSAAYRLFALPLALFSTLGDSTIAIAKSKPTLSPIEARTTLAFTLVLGLVLAYFAGGRPSVSGKVLVPKGVGEKGLDDLDGWDRYGREVAFRARRERLAINRYYTFLPPSVSSPTSHSHEAHHHLHHMPAQYILSAFSTPPLVSPVNIFVPFVIGTAAIVGRLSGSEDTANRFKERGRLWVWRFGIWPLGVWAVVAKVVRKSRGRE